MRNKLRLEKRESVSTIRIVLTSILFTLIAFAFCGIIIASVGFNPLEVYGKMLNKVFLSEKGIRKMINASLPLMFCGLGVALTFKMNLNNIGAEGQYAMGAIFGGAFVLYGPEIRGIGGGIILAVMCFLGGAFWALLCAIPKAYWNVNESITTLMLNYIALIILSYLVLGPWKMPGQNVGQTKRIPVGLEIPEINGTSVHPESYEAAEKLLKKQGFSLEDISGGKLTGLSLTIKDYARLAKELEIGEITLRDIVKELEKPGRDPRDEMPKPILRTDVLDMKDLKEGMILKGTVRNVIDFGVFVDIGVHQDGLVHISEITDKKFIKHPLEVVSVGDIVDVKVMSVDLKKKRIQLTMKGIS